MTAAARPHRHRQHTKLGYAAASVALATLAGCTGGAPAPTARTLPASPSSSTSTTSRPPATTTSAAGQGAGPRFPEGLPAAARAHTAKGAEAFAIHVLNRVNLAWTKPDPQALIGLCLSSSRACASWTTDATSLKLKGHRYDGNPVRIVSLASKPAANASQRVVVQLIQERRRVVDDAGSVISTDQRKQLELVALLTWSKTGWQVASFGTVGS